MFAEDSPPLPWDRENAYKREAIELYYEVCLFLHMLFLSLLTYELLFDDNLPQLLYGHKLIIPDKRNQ